MVTLSAPSQTTIDPLPHPLREAPASEPMPGTPDPSNTIVLDEPVLNVTNIQGNILGGFNKDHQLLVFLRVDDADKARRWLKTQIPYIATAAEVIAFNRLFKAAKERRRTEGSVKATWVNIAFTYAGLHKLACSKAEVEQFKDTPFREGLAGRAVLLNDPVDAQNQPTGWVVGGPHNPHVDIVLIIAADDRADMLAERDRIEDSVVALANPDGTPLFSGVHIVFQDEGANLPPPISGHEHFGFLDGVSQPGVRGLVSPDKSDLLTPRQNPDKRDQTEGGKIIAAQGKPGQDVLWPGEFVFGYPTQVPIVDGAHFDGPNATAGPDSLTGITKTDDLDASKQMGPDWARDGSFLVFRRLRQNVGAFHQFLHDTAQKFPIADPPNASAPRQVGASLVGRWPSGAPIERETDKENLPLGDSDCNNNNFEFHDGKDPILAILPGQPGYSPDNCVDDDVHFPQAQDDDQGLRCPFSGHIRKSYPRDDSPLNDGGDPQATPNESDTQTHRMLRRGIPFGPVSRSTPDAPVDDPADRGLHFLAYQTSIERQFEFVTRFWINNPHFKEPFGTIGDAPNLRGGYDPIIGQNATPGENRTREFTMTFPDPDNPGKMKPVRVSTAEFIQKTGIADWVTPTGGGYYFAPSLYALEAILSA